VAKIAPLRSRLCNCLKLQSRARQQAGFSDFCHGLLEKTCVLRERRQMMKDYGIEFKQHYFPDAGRPAWRVETREYLCAEPTG
jgi:hypothetical protein